jgi:heptosyltransferase-2
LNKILVIQTAFIGDVVLALGTLEKLHQFYPKASIDFLVRQGNESLVHHHPFINQLLVWNKQENKYGNLWKILKQIRGNKYNAVFNLQRFAASGLLTGLSGAKFTAGFNKNPFSFLFTESVKHDLENNLHELDRNQMVIASKTTKTKAFPRLYPTPDNFEQVKPYQTDDYVVIAPASVWFTKQVPVEKWVELIKYLSPKLQVYLIGSKGDSDYANAIIEKVNSQRVNNLCGELNLLESAALMKTAKMNYTNDSAPMHMAGAVQAPVTALYCSTMPSFGFGPFLPSGKFLEIEQPLNCRPCGLHGQSSCPEKHFNCAQQLNVKQVAV